MGAHTATEGRMQMGCLYSMADVKQQQQTDSRHIRLWWIPKKWTKFRRTRLIIVTDKHRCNMAIFF